MTSCSICQASDHDPNHANSQHGLAMIEADLIVAAQPPRFIEPAKGSFHDPAFGQNFESLDLVAPPDDFQFEFAVGPELFNPGHQSPQVAAVGPNDLQSAEQSRQALDQ